MQRRPLSAHIPIGEIGRQLCSRIEHRNAVRIDQVALTVLDDARIVIARMSCSRIECGKSVPDIRLIAEQQIKIVTDLEIEQRIAPRDPADAAVRRIREILLDAVQSYARHY